MNYRLLGVSMASMLLSAAVAFAQLSPTPGANSAPAGGSQKITASPASTNEEDVEGVVVTRRGQFDVTSASISVGYSSVGVESGSSNAALARLTADYYAISSINTRYSSRNERGGTNLTYTPVYIRRFRYSDLSSLNHMLAFSTRRQVAARNWLSFSLSGSAASAEQIAFDTSQAGRLAGSGASDGSLSEAILGQHQTNNDIAYLTSTSGSDPLSLAIYGGRVLRATASIDHEWLWSPRTVLRSQVSVMRGQGLQDSTTVAQGFDLRSSSASASWGILYSLSPRTTTGASISYFRNRTSGINNQTTSVEYSVGRHLSRRWTSNVSAGIGRVSLLPSAGVPTGPGAYTFSGSGTVGYRTRIHSIVGSIQQNAGDSYGVGAGSTRRAQVALNSARPGRAWMTSFGGGYQSLNGTRGQIQTWQVQTGYTRRLNSTMTIATEFAYMAVTNAAIPTLESALSGYQTRVTMSWNAADLDRR